MFNFVFVISRLAQDKERQGAALKDKLEELKKRRSARNTPTPSLPPLEPPVTAREITIVEDLE